MRTRRSLLYYKTGNNFLKKKDFVSAVESYKDAVLIDPSYFKAYCNLGVAYKNLGLYKEAEESLEKALKIKPHSAVIYNNLGNVATAKGDFAQARLFYQKAIAIYPQYKKAHYNLGQVLYFSGDHKTALEARIKLEKLSY